MSEGKSNGDWEDGGEPWVSAGERELQELLLNSVDVTAFLEELAVLAASTLSTTSKQLHCGVTALRHRKPSVVASSDNRARSLDEIQNAFDDGPCLTALRRHEIVLVQDVSREVRWPEYVGVATEQGIGLILAIPLELAGEAEAVVNLYAEKPGSLSPLDIDTARNFVANAARSLRLALKLGNLRDTSNDLAAAMKSRATVDMAVGVIMAQNRCTHDEAVYELTRSSGARKARLREMAATVVGAVSGKGSEAARESIQALLEE
ncbi:response regulator receiver and ANTAR domain protein [Arthrobacter sp. SLBN-100]|uniref:GAF and ANTAR domain-containing protein n=1 Tax=Arthrobacter sp. SLBN-100 TaxID=2768450 RepID=UPI00116FACEE|nr:GAF and ANTAR domain-containing protein [Arthrobacter sp. SLBN-100]TQJ67798.1 response regulator receiver and ANTAR domain protein [Arthrobacter sp. SLBN-100]